MNRHIPLLALLAVLGACGDDGAPPAAKPAAGKPTAPYGVYTRRVTRADLRRTARARSEYGRKQHPPPTGRYRLVLAKGAGQDVLKVTDPGEFTVAMDVTLARGRLNATTYVDPARASFCGPEVAAPAVYAYRLRGAALRLTRKVDQCADRDAMLTGVWAKG
jgi:hypothetical protein